jgi:hypothetical protein
VTIRISAPSSMLVANVVGVLGLAAVVVAIGGLAGLWWALLAGGLVLVGLSVIAATHDTAEQTAAAPMPADGPAAAQPVRPATAPVSPRPTAEAQPA